MSKTTTKKKPNIFVLLVVVLVVVGGLLVWLSTQQAQLQQQTVVEGTDGEQQNQVESGDITLLPPVSDSDHVRGNDAASVVLVEYSDLNCQFCQQYHVTMLRLLEKYPELAWVYRHMPLLDSDQPSLISECVDSLYSENEFWQYVDRYFSTVNSTSQAATTEGALDVLKALELDVQSVENCAQQAEVQQALDEVKKGGQSVGVFGTPTTVLVVDGEPVSLIEGAATYEDMVEYLDYYIKNN